MTQNKMILEYLKTHPEGITQNDAKDLFACNRLSGRIKDLRNMGVAISTTMETSKNKFGNSVTYARYRLIV